MVFKFPKNQADKIQSFIAETGNQWYNGLIKKGSAIFMQIDLTQFVLMKFVHVEKRVLGGNR